MEIEKIIDEAYQLYMPQDRYEITELYQFVSDHYGHTPKSAPYNILEIGTKFGGTFYLWASLNRSSGLNISIDVSDGGLHGGIPDEEMDKRDLWFCERFDNVKFIRGDSHSQQVHGDCYRLLDRWNTPDTVGKIEKIDFLFIDGDHTEEGVRKDFEMYSPFVRKGGIVAFHDINDSERHRSRNVYVSKFWKELVDSGKYETIEFNSNLDWAGIGVVVI